VVQGYLYGKPIPIADFAAMAGESAKPQPPHLADPCRVAPAALIPWFPARSCGSGAFPLVSARLPQCGV
jgi:hypothetical protein